MQRHNPTQIRTVALNIALGGRHDRQLRFIIRFLLIAVLPRKHALCNQNPPTFPGYAVQIELRLLLFQLGLSLIQLLARLGYFLIEVRGIDECQHLSFSYVVANIYKTLLYVAIGSRINKGNRK